MNGHDLVIFWMDDFKCVLETAFMRLTFKAGTQSGSLGSGAAACLSEAATAQNLEAPGSGILFLCFRLAPRLKGDGREGVKGKRRGRGRGILLVRAAIIWAFSVPGAIRGAKRREEGQGWTND